MTEFVQTVVKHHIGFITLDRPKALNSLSLDMVRAITSALRAWQHDNTIRAIVIRSSSERAFCAGGDIRFFHDAGNANPMGGSALLEDFFTEEYALNHLIHHYPKPYIAIMDGIVMGGGMGVAQGSPANRMRIVTERTKMAMPEVNIGLFPDVGGSYFLSRLSSEIGTYLGVTGETIGPADALYADLADVFIPAAKLPALMELLASEDIHDVRTSIREFATPLRTHAAPDTSVIAGARMAIDKHFSHDDVRAIIASLMQDVDQFAQKTLDTMRKRSPLMMCVTLAQLRRGAAMNVANCLRMERTMVRHSFEQGEVLEGIRSVVIDKDNSPQWMPATLDEVTPKMVARYFEPAWPPHAHPLRDLS